MNPSSTLPPTESRVGRRTRPDTRVSHTPTRVADPTVTTGPLLQVADSGPDGPAAAVTSSQRRSSDGVSVSDSGGGTIVVRRRMRLSPSAATTGVTNGTRKPTSTESEETKSASLLSPNRLSRHQQRHQSPSTTNNIHVALYSPPTVHGPSSYSNWMPHITIDQTGSGSGVGVAETDQKIAVPYFSPSHSSHSQSYHSPIPPQTANHQLTSRERTSTTTTPRTFRMTPTSPTQSTPMLTSPRMNKSSFTTTATDITSPTSLSSTQTMVDDQYLAAPVAGDASNAFHSTAPSSFVIERFDASAAYLRACQTHSLTPNSIVERMFANGLAERRVWDCGYLYLGHRGVLPLLDVLVHPACSNHVEELSLRGTGMRNSEVVKLIELVRNSLAHTLRTLDLADNPISESGGAQLLLLVNLAPALTRVTVDHTRIDQVTVRAITSACLAKLALHPSQTKLTTINRRYTGHLDDEKNSGTDDKSEVEKWKNKLLEAFMRKGQLADIAIADADEAKMTTDAAQRERDRQTIRLLLRCLQTDNDIVGLLLRFDEEKHPEVWRDIRVVRRFVKRLIETGHHRKAFELADHFIHPRPRPAQPTIVETSAVGTIVGDGRPIQPPLPPPNFQNDQVLQWWRVYALARSRNFTDAFKEINLLLPKNLSPTIHANLLGLAGMLRKCLFESGQRADLDSFESKLQEEDANESANLYLASYETAHGLMEGIAAATMLRLGGKDEQSNRLAKKLLKEATAELALLNRSRSLEDVERKLNLYSALAEANINLQRPNAAYKYYQQAVEVAGTNVNHLSQLQQNLQLLSAARVRIGDVMQLFHAGNVCVFMGLAVDHPQYDSYAFPSERDLELEISYQLDVQIEQHQIQIGFVSLACGSEILFAEKMLEKKCELHVVLPFHMEDFFASSIDYGLSAMYRWHARAQSILKRCEVHYVTTERFLNDHGLFHFQEIIMEGLAIIRARELGVGSPIALAVLDSSPPFQACRPNNFIRNWKAKRSTTCTIDLQDVRRRVLNLPGVPLASQKTIVRRFSEAAQTVDATETPLSNSNPPLPTSTTGGPPLLALGPGPVSGTAGDETDDESMFTAKPPPSSFNNSYYDGHPRPRRTSTLHTTTTSPPIDASQSPAIVGGSTATMQHTTSSTGKFLTAMQFASKITRVVKYMMFADIEPTTTMTEESTPIFFKTFFKLLEKARKESKVSPFYANTWGSGLYFIFHTVDQCAEFSLHLLQVVAKMDWHSLGLPPATACLGMHGGPLFPGYNPVEEKDFYFGAHVCRAARIKGVTPAGHAYASEQFVAALAVADGDRKQFFFEYLGHRDLAKSYDRCPLYRLCRIEDVRKHALINTAAFSPTAANGTTIPTSLVPTPPTVPPTVPNPPVGELDSSTDPFATPGTQNRRIKERRQRDRKGDKTTANGYLPTPFSANEVGLLNSGPLTPMTIERATPFFISKLVEHYLSLDTNAEGLMYWENVTLLHALVSRLIALGQTHVAFLVVQKALGYDSAWKNDLKLKYFRVLALRHTQKADEFMKELKDALKSHPNPSAIPVELRASVLSLSGRMLKDKYYDSIRNNDPQPSYAHESAREYFFSYELKHSSFPAINAATMLLLSKQKERARALAKFSVRLVADELLARSRQNWNLSSATDKFIASQALEGSSLNLPSKDKNEVILGDGTVLDSKTVQEENERAARGEVAGKTSATAPGEGAKGGPVGEEYWMYAAMGEAYLVLDEPEKCISWYKHALEKAAGHMGSISSMYRNFLLLQSCMTVPKELHDLFLSSLGRVLVCSSHPLTPWNGPYKPDVTASPKKVQIDEESEDLFSWPQSVAYPITGKQSISIAPPINSLSGPLRLYRMIEDRVLVEIRRHIDTARPTVAFVLLLSDTDLLFAECLIERGVEVHVLLVYTKPVFLEHCIEHGFERLHDWKGRLEILFKRCILHFVTRDKQKNAQRQLLYHFNRRVLQGLTILRAQQLDCGNPLALCVLDGLDQTGQPIGETNPADANTANFGSPGSYDTTPVLSSPRKSAFPPLDRSSAGIEFPAQWCALNVEHTCTIINLNAIRQLCTIENGVIERNKAAELAQSQAIALKASRVKYSMVSPPTAPPHSIPDSDFLPSVATPSTLHINPRYRKSRRPSLPMIPVDTVVEQKEEVEESPSDAPPLVLPPIKEPIPSMTTMPTLTLTHTPHPRQTRLHPYADRTLPTIVASPPVHTSRRLVGGDHADSSDGMDETSADEMAEEDTTKEVSERPPPEDSNHPPPHLDRLGSMVMRVNAATAVELPPESEYEDVTGGETEDETLVEREREIVAFDTNSAVNTAWELAASTALATGIQQDGLINSQALVEAVVSPKSSPKSSSSIQTTPITVSTTIPTASPQSSPKSSAAVPTNVPSASPQSSPKSSATVPIASPQSSPKSSPSSNPNSHHVTPIRPPALVTLDLDAPPRPASMPCSPSTDQIEISLEQLMAPIGGALSAIEIKSAIPKLIQPQPITTISKSTTPTIDPAISSTSSAEPSPITPTAPTAEPMTENHLATSFPTSSLIHPALAASASTTSLRTNFQPGISPTTSFSLMKHQSISGTPEMIPLSSPASQPIGDGLWVEIAPIALPDPALPIAAYPQTTSTSIRPGTNSPPRKHSYHTSPDTATPPRSAQHTTRLNHTNPSSLASSPSHLALSHTYTSSSRVPKPECDSINSNPSGAFLEMVNTSSSAEGMAAGNSSSSSSSSAMGIISRSPRTYAQSVTTTPMMRGLSGIQPAPTSPVHRSSEPNTSASVASFILQANSVHQNAMSVSVAAMVPLPPSRTTSRAVSRRPSITGMADLILPTTHERSTIMSILDGHPMIDTSLEMPVAISLGRSHTEPEPDLAEEVAELERKAKEEADAIAKAVDATYSQPEEPINRFRSESRAPTSSRIKRSTSTISHKRERSRISISTPFRSDAANSSDHEMTPRRANQGSSSSNDRRGSDSQTTSNQGSGTNSSCGPTTPLGGKRSKDLKLGSEGLNPSQLSSAIPSAITTAAVNDDRSREIGLLSRGQLPRMADSYTARPQRRGHRKTNSTPLNLDLIKQIVQTSTEKPETILEHRTPSPNSINSPAAISPQQLPALTTTDPTPTTVMELANTTHSSAAVAPTSEPMTPTSDRTSSVSASASGSKATSRAGSAKRRRRKLKPHRSNSPPHSHLGPIPSVNLKGSSMKLSSNSPSFIGPTLTEASYSRAVRFIIFADVRNYSKLSQEQTPLFCTHFLNIVRQVIDLFLEPFVPPIPGQPPQPSSLQFWNTWGDGLFVVFSDPAQCSRFALVLLQKVHQTKWQNWGLPPELTMRVGMHAGPVLVGWDPVVRHMNYFGPHVLYAQLIEPITTPGCAFATAQFAACLATSPDAQEFKLEYIGSSVLEKEFADQDYAALSGKEKQDFARCHLYHGQTTRKQQTHKRSWPYMTEDKHFSSTRVQVNETSMMNQHTVITPAAATALYNHNQLTNGQDQTMQSKLSHSGSGLLRPESLMGQSSHLISPSITYSLLKIEELKTERENQQLELERESQQNAMACPTIPDHRRSSLPSRVHVNATPIHPSPPLPPSASATAPHHQPHHLTPSTLHTHRSRTPTPIANSVTPTSSITPQQQAQRNMLKHS